eukprot:2504307-Pleurochrysis_carterae.AAC.1
MGLGAHHSDQGRAGPGQADTHPCPSAADSGADSAAATRCAPTTRCARSGTSARTRCQRASARSASAATP